MSEELVMKLINDAFWMMLKLSLPTLLVGLLVGVVVGIFQATTQIQEMTLSFIPKMIAIFAVIMLFGNWMMISMIEYTKELFLMIVSLK